MSARIFSIVNAVGCFLLVVFILVQWKIGTGMEHELRDAKTATINEHNARIEAEKRADALESDVVGLKTSIDSIRSDAEEKTRSLKEQIGQSEALNTGLTQAQEQVKVQDEAIKARDEAIKQRDDRLRETNETLAATRKRLDEAIAKLKQAAAKPQ
ncbi:hypothetical protein [Luteolibacter sp. LG18]|uniref:hypothetical protein n=1 Tax=Luteolibacter sp. LG18 TaxID=2819286 RepID=UPI002B2F50C9|nr:hypothetical protein llg_04590 [Luteolibacter sp. LG18]